MILLLFLMPVSTWRLFSWLVQPAGSGVVRRTLGGEMWGARHVLQVVRVKSLTPGESVGLANCSCRLKVEIRAKPLPQTLLSDGRPQVTTQKQVPFLDFFCFRRCSRKCHPSISRRLTTDHMPGVPHHVADTALVTAWSWWCVLTVWVALSALCAEAVLFVFRSCHFLRVSRVLNGKNLMEVAVAPVL